MKEIFDRLYNCYHQDVYRFIFYMIKDKQTAEDLIQEVYLRVFKSYGSFRGDSSEKTWLFSIARHVTIDYIRSQNRRRKRILEFFDWNKKGRFIPDKQISLDDHVIQKEEIKQVYNLLDKITLDQKSVLILRFLQSFSIKETAEILQFSISKVKTTQHRGLNALRQYILEDQKKGGDSDEIKQK